MAYRLINKKNLTLTKLSDPHELQLYQYPKRY